MKKNIQKFISTWILLSILTHTANAQTLTVNTIANPPVSPFLSQIFSQSGIGVRARLHYSMFDSTLMNPTVRVSGKIQCLSPSPFTIELRNDPFLGAFIDMNIDSMPSHMLTKLELEQAFGNFDVANLTYNGIPPIGPNDKLPDGVYSICFTATARKYQKKVPPFCCTDDVNCSCPGDHCGCWNQLQFYEYIDSRCANFTIITCTQPQNGMLLNTIVTPPINPIIAQSISTGSVKSNLQFNNPPACSTRVKLFGKIQRMSPSPFTIELDPNYQQQAPITINPGITQLTPNQMIEAFNNFNESNLIVNGINLSSIKDANNDINYHLVN